MLANEDVYEEDRAKKQHFQQQEKQQQQEQQREGKIDDDGGIESKRDEEPIASASSSSSFEIHDSFSEELMSRYDGFILDQWGVMHNGMESIQGAPECVAELARRGKRLVILSNSPSSEKDTLAKLPQLGFDPAHFHCGAVTSGVLAARHIWERSTTLKKEKSKNGSPSCCCKALVMAWASPFAPPVDEFLSRCGDDNNKIHVVNSVDDDPDFIVVQGNEVLLQGPPATASSESNNGADIDGGGDNKQTQQQQQLQEQQEQQQKYRSKSLGDYVLTGNMDSVIEPLLQQCVSKQIPLICVDPDLITVNPDGSIYHMPGKIAERYQEMGGPVEYFGKPYEVGFLECIQRLGNGTSSSSSSSDNRDHDDDCAAATITAATAAATSITNSGGIPQNRMVHVGDSLPHDVAGANAVHLNSILVLGGVHRVELQNELGEMASKGSLTRLFGKQGQTPTHVVPLLKL